MTGYTAHKKKKLPSKRTRGSKAKRVRSNLNAKAAKAFLLTLLVGILSILYIAGTSFYNWLNKNFVSAESAASINTSYLTILYVVADDIHSDSPEISTFEIKLIDKVNKKVVTYVFPNDLEVYSGDKYGLEAISKQFALAKVANEDELDEAITQLTKIAFNFIAFPIDRYVVTSSQSSDKWEQFFTGDVNFIEFMSFAGKSGFSYSSNFSLQEVYSITNFVAGLPEDRFIRNTLKKDIGNVIDYELKEITLDSEFAKLGKSIAVLNAGGKQGAAGFSARVLSNLGGHIVVVDNSVFKFGENFLISDSPEDATAQFIAKTLGISKIISKASAKELVDPIDLERADLLVIIGQN